MKLSKFADLTIEYSFYAIFFLVPLIWLPVNYELFEFNKMILTYILTIFVATAWVLKILVQKNFVFKRTVLDWPILIFLAANVLSTLFSIDPHTSIYGYYSRFNGGLLSTIAYSLLFFALTNNFDKNKAKNLLLVGLSSAGVVAFYGLLEHPNPLFATIENGQRIWHGIDYKYWAEAVEIRIFSTLGQPNWLAAYLAMLLPAGVSFILIFKRVWQKTLFLLFSLLLFLAITFTLSRAGSLGLLAAGVVFSLFLLLYHRSSAEKLKTFFHFKLGWAKNLERGWVWLAVLLAGVLLINSYFGNALSLRGASPSKANQPAPAAAAPTGQSQLEVGGSQTSQIRLIVWKGAFDIFRHYPLFGSGVETFGYSYYLYRPVEHNQTVEWDFLYNKAHNEYLNYLSTTGIVGFMSYLLLIGVFVFWVVKYLLKSTQSAERLLVLGLFAGYVSYLIQNIFGFSVVIIAIFFYLFPALAFIFTENIKETDFFQKRLDRYFKNSTSNNLLQITTIVVALFSLSFVGRMWLADTFYAQGSTSDSAQNYKNLKTAISLFPNEPLYQAELAAAEADIASNVDDKSLKADLMNEAHDLTKNLEQTHPHNTALERDRVQTLYSLSQIDPKYTSEALQAAQKLAEMAPTDASIQYNLAVIYSVSDKKAEALKQIEKVLKLKPDHPEAKELEKKLRSA